MSLYSVGDQVIVRFGTHKGRKAKILQCQLAEVYKVKIKDGAVLSFPSKQLEIDKEAVRGFLS